VNFKPKIRHFGVFNIEAAPTPEVTVLNPGDLFLKVKTCFSQKRYGHVNERLKMRTNENSRSTADDGITLRVSGSVVTEQKFRLSKSKDSKEMCFQRTILRLIFGSSVSVPTVSFYHTYITHPSF
jgi:hypothetical protein